MNHTQKHATSGLFRSQLLSDLLQSFHKFHLQGSGSALFPILRLCCFLAIYRGSEGFTKEEALSAIPRANTYHLGHLSFVTLRVRLSDVGYEVKRI